MQKIEYFCDRCGKRVESVRELVGVMPFGLEICDNCNDKFVNIQANFLGGYDFPVELTKVQPALNSVSLDPCDNPRKVKESKESKRWHEEHGID